MRASVEEWKRLLDNVKPKAKVPAGFGLWSESMQLMWLRQNQKKSKRGIANEKRTSK